MMPTNSSGKNSQLMNAWREEGGMQGQELS
jgi:hypothetical protein